MFGMALTRPSLTMQLTSGMDVFAHVGRQKIGFLSNYCDNNRPYDKWRFNFCQMWHDFYIVSSEITTNLNFCHQGSWQNRGDRKRGEWESTPFVFSSSTSLFNSYGHAFRHDGNTAFVRTFYYNVTAKPLYRVPAAFAPRDSEPAQTRRSPVLSQIEMSGTKL